MRARRTIQTASIALAVAHMLILAAYTFPAGWVPTRPRYWSQAYARVLFHQDWRLFAPDPPACACALEYKTSDDDAWRPIAEEHHHFIWRRMTSNACRYAESACWTDSSMCTVPDALSISLANMTTGHGDHHTMFRIERGSGPCAGAPRTIAFQIDRGR